MLYLMLVAMNDVVRFLFVCLLCKYFVILDPRIERGSVVSQRGLTTSDFCCMRILKSRFSLFLSFFLQNEHEMLNLG